MDSIFLYTAKRSLLSAHAIDDQCQIEISLMEDTQMSRAVQKTQVRSLGGAVETLWDRSDTEWTISFEPVRGYKLSQLQEFLDSTESGETFTAYLYGTESKPILLKRVDDGYQLAPFKRVGSSTSDWFQASAIRAVQV